MSAKPRIFFKVISFLLCFLLLFEQSGFAQVAGQLDVSGYMNQLRNALTTDKFRPLHLRYLSYNNLNNTFELLLDKGDELQGLKRLSPDLKGLSPKGTVPSKRVVEDASKTLLNYFFIGVSLPNDTFWVNLRPDSPDEIIDPLLAQTDVGKILLEADLQLKKDTAKFTSPETPEGKEYWNKLYQKAGEILGYDNVTIPTLTRPWIVPDEIIIRESDTNAYIYKATLKVMLEQDYLEGPSHGVKGDRRNTLGVIASPAAGGPKQSLYKVYDFKDDRLKQLNEYSSQLIRELIIPKITKEVNSAKKYAPLRQVYYSLIMAHWFKQNFYGKGGLYSWLIDRKSLVGLTSKEAWSKDTYFKDYQKSFKEGEYNYKEPVQTPFGQSIRSYFSGGLNMAPMGAAIKAGQIDAAGRPLSNNLAENNPRVAVQCGSQVGTINVAAEDIPHRERVEITPSQMQPAAILPVSGVAQSAADKQQNEGYRNKGGAVGRRQFLQGIVATALSGIGVRAEADETSVPKEHYRPSNPERIHAMLRKMSEASFDEMQESLDSPDDAISFLIAVDYMFKKTIGVHNAMVRARQDGQDILRILTTFFANRSAEEMYRIFQQYSVFFSVNKELVELTQEYRGKALELFRNEVPEFKFNNERVSLFYLADNNFIVAAYVKFVLDANLTDEQKKDCLQRPPMDAVDLRAKVAGISDREVFNFIESLEKHPLIERGLPPLFICREAVAFVQHALAGKTNQTQFGLVLNDPLLPGLYHIVYLFQKKSADGSMLWGYVGFNPQLHYAYPQYNSIYDLVRNEFPESGSAGVIDLMQVNRSGGECLVPLGNINQSFEKMQETHAPMTKQESTIWSQIAKISLSAAALIGLTVAIIKLRQRGQVPPSGPSAAAEGKDAGIASDDRTAPAAWSRAGELPVGHALQGAASGIYLGETPDSRLNIDGAEVSSTRSRLARELNGGAASATATIGGQDFTFNHIVTAGSVSFIVEERLSEDELGELLQQALDGLPKDFGFDTPLLLLPANHIIGEDGLDHLAGDCIRNGVVFLHRNLNSKIEALNKINPLFGRVLLQVLLAHELRHEATGRHGTKAEKEFQGQDVLLIQEMITDQGDLQQFYAALQVLKIIDRYGDFARKDPGFNDKTSGETAIEKLNYSIYILSMHNREPRLYTKCADDIRRIAVYNPNLYELAKESLEDILRETTDTNSCAAVASAVRDLFGLKRAQPSTVKALESIYGRHGLGPDAYHYANLALRYIAKFNTSLITKSTIHALCRAMVQEYLSAEVYGSTADLIRMLQGLKPELRHCSYLANLILDLPPRITRHTLAHYDLYANGYFLSATEDLSAEARYSIGLSAWRIIKRYGLELDDANIRKAVDLILESRKKLADMPVFASGRKVINILNDEIDTSYDVRYFSLPHVEKFEREYGVDASDIDSYQGTRCRESIRMAISKSDGPLTIYFDGHGGRNHLWLSGGFEHSPDLEHPDGISYQQLGDALLERISRGGSLADTVILLDSCYAYNFAFSLLDYLRKQKIEEFPIIVTVANFDNTANFDTFFRSIKRASKHKKIFSPLNFSHLFAAEEHAFEIQDSAVFMNVGKEALIAKFGRLPDSVGAITGDLAADKYSSLPATVIEASVVGTSTHAGVDEQVRLPSAVVEIGFEGGVEIVPDEEAKYVESFDEAWRNSKDSVLEIDRNQLVVLGGKDMGNSFVTKEDPDETMEQAWERGENPQAILELRLVKGAGDLVSVFKGSDKHVLRLGNRVLIAEEYWNGLIEQEQLNVLMHEAMAEWMERTNNDAGAMPMEVEGLSKEIDEENNGATIGGKLIYAEDQVRKDAHRSEVDRAMEGVAQRGQAATNGTIGTKKATLQWTLLDPEKIFNKSGDFLEAVGYFNNDILAVDDQGNLRPLDWERIINLYEIIRGDKRNDNYSSSIRQSRLKFASSNKIIDAANTRFSEPKDVALHALQLYTLIREQILAHHPGFQEDGMQTRQDDDHPHSASGHYRLAWFLMNYFLIRNGYSPFYFKDKEESDRFGGYTTKIRTLLMQRVIKAGRKNRPVDTDKQSPGTAGIMEAGGLLGAGEIAVIVKKAHPDALAEHIASVAEIAKARGVTDGAGILSIYQEVHRRGGFAGWGGRNRSGSKAKVAPIPTVESYVNDIEEAAGRGEIFYGPSAGKVNGFYHLTQKGGGKKILLGTLKSSNTRLLSEGARQIFRSLLRSAKKDDLRVMEIGAGAGKTVSEMSLISEEEAGGVIIDISGSLDPIAPRFRLIADNKQIRKWIYEFVSEHPDEDIAGLSAYLSHASRWLRTKKDKARELSASEIVTTIPFELVLALQNKDRERFKIFELLDTVFVRRQYIGEFLDGSFNIPGRYDFIHEDRGGIYYADDKFLAIRKIASMLSNDGICYIEYAGSSMDFDSNMLSQDLIAITAKNVMQVILIKANGRHAALVDKMGAKREIINGPYLVDDFGLFLRKLSDGLTENSVPAAKPTTELGGIDLRAMPITVRGAAVSGLTVQGQSPHNVGQGDGTAVPFNAAQILQILQSRYGDRSGLAEYAGELAGKNTVTTRQEVLDAYANYSRRNPGGFARRGKDDKRGDKLPAESAAGAAGGNPTSLTSVPSEGRIAFENEFGKDAADILQFVTGGTDLSGITSYESVRKFGFRIVYEHTLTINNRRFIFYTKQYMQFPYSVLNFDEEYRRARIASSIKVGPRVKLIGVRFVSLNATGKNPVISSRDPYIEDFLDAFGYALGKLHGRGVVHNDIAFRSESGIVIAMAHIFWNREEHRIEFIDFGKLPVTIDTNKEYELIKRGLLPYGISIGLITKKFIPAYKRGKRDVNTQAQGTLGELSQPFIPLGIDGVGAIIKRHYPDPLPAHIILVCDMAKARNVRDEAGILKIYEGVLQKFRASGGFVQWGEDETQQDKTSGIDSSTRSAGSPSIPPQGKLGGIDFTGMPILTQPMAFKGQSPTGTVPDSNVQRQSPLSDVLDDMAETVSVGSGIVPGDLAKEWQEIERMLQANITPSTQRIKEYLQGCCENGCMDKEIDKVLGCIAQILRIEEERSSSTDSALKEILVVLEKGGASAGLSGILDAINVAPGNPATLP